MMAPLGTRCYRAAAPGDKGSIDIISPQVQFTTGGSPSYTYFCTGREPRTAYRSFRRPAVSDNISEEVGRDAGGFTSAEQMPDESSSGAT